VATPRKASRPAIQATVVAGTQVPRAGQLAAQHQPLRGADAAQQQGGQ
jgi:hypothetical protein